MDLSSYITNIVNEVYHQNIAQLAVPSYCFTFKEKLKLSGSFSSPPSSPGYDSDDLISTDVINPSRDIFLTDILYTPQITVLYGKDMTAREIKDWTIDRSPDPITIHDLVELTSRLKPRRYIFGGMQVSPIRKLNVRTFNNRIEVYYYY